MYIQPSTAIVPSAISNLGEPSLFLEPPVIDAQGYSEDTFVDAQKTLQICHLRPPKPQTVALYHLSYKLNDFVNPDLPKSLQASERRRHEAFNHGAIWGKEEAFKSIHRSGASICTISSIDTPFTTHLKDAIEVNRDRTKIYADITRGKSKALSRFLICMEYITLLYAYFYDWLAKGWNKKGIPLLQKDFASMDDIDFADTKPKFAGDTSLETFKDLKKILREYRRDVKKAIKHADFEMIATLTHKQLIFFENKEEETNGHFAMTKHILESIGIAAVNAIEYSQLSGGRTKGFSKRFLKFQLQAFIMGLPIIFDQMAQRIHSLGAGIIVNDIPDIPFKKAWNDYQSARGMKTLKTTMG